MIKLIIEITIYILLASILFSALFTNWMIEKHPRTLKRIYKKSALVKRYFDTFFID